MMLFLRRNKWCQVVRVSEILLEQRQRVGTQHTRCVFFLAVGNTFFEMSVGNFRNFLF